MVVEAWLAEERRQEEATRRRASAQRRTWCQCMGRCCCFCFLLNLVLITVSVAFLYHGVHTFVQDYSVTHAAPLIAYRLPHDRIRDLEARVRETLLPTKNDDDEEPPAHLKNLVLTQDEVNGWLAAQLGGLQPGRLYVELLAAEGGQLQAQVRFPLHPYLPGGRGRYFVARLLLHLESCTDQAQNCGWTFLDGATTQVTFQLLVPPQEASPDQYRNILHTRTFWTLARDRTRRVYWSFAQIFHWVDDLTVAEPHPEEPDLLFDPYYWKIDFQQNGYFFCRVHTDKCELLSTFLDIFVDLFPLLTLQRADVLQTMDRVTGLSIHDGFLVVHVEGGGDDGGGPNTEDDDGHANKEAEEAVPTSNYHIVHRAMPSRPPRRPVRPRRSLLEPVATHHGQEL
jgi:hypothetical protein